MMQYTNDCESGYNTDSEIESESDDEEEKEHNNIIDSFINSYTDSGRVYKSIAWNEGDLVDVIGLHPIDVKYGVACLAYLSCGRMLRINSISCKLKKAMSKIESLYIYNYKKLEHPIYLCKKNDNIFKILFYKSQIFHGYYYRRVGYKFKK
jgi:hypothetical protein